MVMCKNDIKNLSNGATVSQTSASKTIEASEKEKNDKYSFLWHLLLERKKKLRLKRSILRQKWRIVLQIEKLLLNVNPLKGKSQK